MKGISLLIEGHVQGVGFRYFTAITAEKHQIKGWVRNTSNGEVEIEAEGEALNIDAFRKEISEGHRFSKVDKVTVNELQTLKGHKQFKITN